MNRDLRAFLAAVSVGQVYRSANGYVFQAGVIAGTKKRAEGMLRQARAEGFLADIPAAGEHVFVLSDAGEDALAQDGEAA